MNTVRAEDHGAGRLLLNLSDKGEGSSVPGSVFIREERKKDVAQKASIELKRRLRAGLLGISLFMASPAKAADLVHVAEAHIGRGETWADNTGAWVQRYTHGARVPWCAGFVSFALKESRIQAPYTLRARDFLKLGHRVSQPAAGDVVVFKRGRDMGHAAIIESVIDPKNFWIIEGNHGAFPSKVKRSLVHAGTNGREILGIVRLK